MNESSSELIEIDNKSDRMKNEDKIKSNNLIENSNKMDNLDSHIINNTTSTDHNMTNYMTDHVKQYTNNHLSNGYVDNLNGIKIVSTSKSCSKKTNRNSGGLTRKERITINIDSLCQICWMLIILIFALINMYNFGYLHPKCKEYKSTLIFFSQLISSLTAIETTTFYLIWFFLTNSRYYHMQMIYDSITGIHILIAFFNILYAVTTFLTRTCHEEKITSDYDFRNLDKFHLVGIKYDLKIAGLGHILLTIIVAFSAIHLTTKRSKFFLHSLTKRGLLTEYMWETLD